MSKRSHANNAYDHRYRAARRALLATDPPCHWCGKPATTADHYPPLAYLREIGADPADAILLPACAPCNYGHVASRRARGERPRSRDW